MIPEIDVWSIFFLPLAAFLIIGLIIRPFFNRYAQVAGYITIISIGLSLVLSAWTLQSVIAEGGKLPFEPRTWLAIGEFQLTMGLMVDSLTAIMLVVVTGVSLMIQIYSRGYMARDPGYARYFAFMALFTASMIGLVLASNIIQLYVFWELVGLCSYLLIGFWYHRPSAAAAAKKAFLVTRLGDFGFLLAILYIFFNGFPLEIDGIHDAVMAGALGGLGLTWIAVGIFSGAVGKSAQFPLHVWLPDAMEGPTPVSALIHAATMVAAGVFLVARFFPLFQASTEAMSAIAIIGASTAIFAATMALVANDIKRVMAYSTISQLGFMMAALGVGAYGAAMFHLFNHAFFKALLFLGAGSVNHATGTFDMRYMGGLRLHLPWTYVLVVLAALSLAGIFPLAGFWSKDEILQGAWRGSGPVASVTFWLLLAAVFLTAFYAFRMVYMTFHGRFRGGADAEMQEQQGTASAHDQGDEHRAHLAESPVVMVLPMVLLGVASVVSGYLANPQSELLGIPAHWFSSFLVPPFAEHGEVLPLNFGLASVSMVVALAGMLFATGMYHFSLISPQQVGRDFKYIYTLFVQKYYMDHLYENLLVVRWIYGRLAAFVDWFDRAIVDATVDVIGWFWRNIGRALSRLQTGQVQAYGVAISVGVILILAAYLLWGQGT